MCNQNYNMQTSLPLEINEESVKVSKKTVTPTFIPYNHRQIQAIYDIEKRISDKHVARVVDDMVEAIPDEQ